MEAARAPSGHVFRVERARGPVWYAKYRLPDGRQVQKKIGPAWTERGRPPAGYFTKRTAEAWLRDVLDEARRGTLSGGANWRRRSQMRQPSGCGSWNATANASRRRSRTIGRRSSLTCCRRSGAADRDDHRPMTSSAGAPRSRTVEPQQEQAADQLHGIFRRAQTVYGLALNPLARVEKHPQRRSSDIEVFSPEEVWALVRAASSEQDAAVFDGCVHRLAARRAARAALARRRLRWRHDPGEGELRGRRADDAEVGQGPGGADGARRRVSASLNSGEREHWSARTTWSSPATPAATSTARR